MTRGLIFWVLMLLWFVFGAWYSWGEWRALGGIGLEFILFLLLGWQVFGPPIKG